MYQKNLLKNLNTHIICKLPTFFIVAQLVTICVQETAAPFQPVSSAPEKCCL